jgi:hypothetical protein
MPTSNDKPKQFSFILTADEHRMLQVLAEADDRSAANWLRLVIRREYEALPRALRGMANVAVHVKAKRGSR